MGIRRYLRDKAQEVLDRHVDRWKAGKLLSSDEELEQSLYHNLLLELDAIGFDDIADFYNVSNEEETK